MARLYTVSDLVAEFLAACGVRMVFGIVSGHTLGMCDAIGRRNAVRFVMARGEAGAAHMADAYARVSGELGVVFSSTGPGAANAVAGLNEARVAGTPLLHITGQSATRFVDREVFTTHDVQDQLGMLKAVSKSAWRIRSPEAAIGILTRAAVEALSVPTGPVSVEIPLDIQNAPVARPAILDAFTLPLPPPRAPVAAELDELAARVLAAKRPMLWLGSGAREAGPEAVRLLDMGFGMVASWKGRGAVPEDHPMNLAGLHGAGSRRIQDFYRTVDLMLVVGSRQRGHEQGDFGVAMPDNRIQIDADPLANGRTFASSWFVCADAKLTLAALLARIAGRMAIEPGYPAEFQAMRRAAIDEYLATLGVYGGFAGQLRAAMPRDALWVRDVTQATASWGQRAFPVYAPRDQLYPVNSGIGVGLPLGIGAALAARGRRTVLMTGDGGFMLSLGELWTAAQERLDLTIIVMNDAGYGVIKKLQRHAHDGRSYFADLRNPDFAGIAALAGMPYWKVDRAEAFGATVAQAIAVDGPGMVEVDMGAIGEFPAYFPFNLPAP